MAIWVMLPEGTVKSDLKVVLKPSEVFVKVGNEVKISGKLWNVLDGDSMTWTIQKGNKLEITAVKAREGLVWQRFLQDDTVDDGEEVSDPEMVDKIHLEVGIYVTSFLSILCLSNSEYWSQKHICMKLAKMKF